MHVFFVLFQVCINTAYVKHAFLTFVDSFKHKYLHILSIVIEFIVGVFSFFFLADLAAFDQCIILIYSLVHSFKF